MHLGELASVRSGLVLARKESREPTPYCYNLLTLRSIHPDGSIAQEDLSVFHASEPLKAEYLTQPGAAGPPAHKKSVRSCAHSRRSAVASATNFLKRGVRIHSGAFLFNRERSFL